MRRLVAMWVFILFIFALLFLAATGRLHWLVAAGAAVLPLLRRLPLLLRAIPLFRQLSGYARSAGWTQRAGQASKIQTRFLAMSLDNDTGDMDGEVLEGPFQGKMLSSLAMNELMILHRNCQSDPDSLQVLEAWLERCHPDWRQHAEPAGQQNSQRSSSGSMTKQEALEILGLEPGASKEKIVGAHRRLMQKLHPDHGGSTYLAAKLNAAKDYLLG